MLAYLNDLKICDSALQERNNSFSYALSLTIVCFWLYSFIALGFL